MAAAILVLIGSLGGVALGQYFAGRNLRRQLAHDATERRADRAHELELHAMQAREDHHARLQDQRLAAYGAFLVAHRQRRIADETVNTWWTARQRVGSEKPIDVIEFNSVDETFRESAERASSAREEVDEAANRVRLVASARVRDAAREVQEKAAIRPKDDSIQSWLAASRDLENAELSLTEAIGAELELDR